MVEAHDLEPPPRRRFQGRFAIEHHGPEQPVVLGLSAGVKRLVPGRAGNAGMQTIVLSPRVFRKLMRLEQDLGPPRRKESVAARFDVSNRLDHGGLTAECFRYSLVVGVSHALSPAGVWKAPQTR